MQENYYVYLIANWNHTVLYSGVTSNLERRVYDHRNKLMRTHAPTYSADKLVYFEQTGDASSARRRETEIKRWCRQKKDQLVETLNTTWKDLSSEWYRSGVCE